MISRDRSLFSLLYFREMAYKIALLPYYMCTFTELTNYCLDGQLLQKDGCFITQSTSKSAIARLIRRKWDRFMQDLWFQNTKIVNVLPITIMIASSAKMTTKKMDVDEGMSFFVLLSSSLNSEQLAHSWKPGRSQENIVLINIISQY